MLEKILVCICCIFMFGMFHNICRMSSSYFPRNKCQKYITIKNDFLSIILIAKGISRDKFVNRHDLNKMSIAGLIAYIIIEPINIYVLISNIMDLFNCENIYFGSAYFTIAFVMLGILTIAFMIVIVVDKY